MARRLPEADLEIVGRLQASHKKLLRNYTRLNEYYNLEQTVRHIGMAVAPELREFTTIVAIPRMVVDEPVLRQRVRGFYRAGDSVNEDQDLRNAYNANNLASNLPILLTETKIFGRAFLSVSSNEVDPEHPAITVESPMALCVNVHRGMIREALRVYRNGYNQVTAGTLYKPEKTVHIVRDDSNGAWVYDEDNYKNPIDEHNFGVVPIVGFVNRRRANEWLGQSEMNEAIGKTDTIARIITNMSVSSDSLALPHRWAAGVKKENFKDSSTGRMLSTIEAYMNALMVSENPQAKFGNFEAAQLSNFHQAVDAILSWAAAEYGFPLRYFGQTSVNPAAEGAIVADETRLIQRVERMNANDGDSLAWTMDLYEWFRTGRRPKARNNIRVLWTNPGTPTLAQTVDAGVKLLQVGALSVEGLWDSMEWDDPRKTLERERLEKQNSDPLLAQVMNNAMNVQQGVPSGSDTGTSVGA